MEAAAWLVVERIGWCLWRFGFIALAPKSA